MTIADALSDCTPEDARSCLYYAGRYIKQAEKFDEYSKDIFEDEERSAPTDSVRSLTMQVIQAIEAREGSSAAKFNDRTTLRVLREISSLEAALPSDLTEEELERGSVLAAEMSPPPITR